MEKVLIRLMLAAVVIVFMTPAAHSELLFYEPFNYPIGELSGNGGAFGLEGTWDNEAFVAPAQVIQDNLVHPVYDAELDAVGNQAQINDSEIITYFLNPMEDDGQDYWISFLYQTAEPGARAIISLIFVDYDVPLVGIEITGGYPYMYSDYNSWLSVGGVTNPLDVQWIVIKAETSGDPANTELLYMWIDPEPGEEPDVAEAGGFIEYKIPKDAVSATCWLDGHCEAVSYYIDEIKIGTTFEDVSVVSKCEQASSPSPPNTQKYVDVNLAELSWEAPTCVDEPTYDIYFNSDPNLTIPKAVQITETSYSLEQEIPLDFETVYYWRVDVTDPNNGVPILYEGPTWRFTTWAQNPTITTQPKSTTVTAGSDTQFSIETVNTTSYQWYYAETSAGTGDPITDADSATLTISEVQETDEGYYYCVATNDDGSTESDHARLLTERLMAHWKFEDNLEDEIDPLNNGTAIGFINYVTGINGKAVEMVDPNGLVTTANDVGQLTEITVSMWIKPNALVEDQEQALLAANGMWDPGTVYIYIDENEIYGLVIEDAEEEISIAVGPVEITESIWNHCILVYDTSTEFSGLYLNGQLIDQESTSVAPILAPLSIGAISAVDGLSYNGLIDDLRIYDYRLSDLQIASLYTEFVPEAEICLENPEYDTSGNCQVDLEDLELLISQWLECNIVPTCLPEE